MKEIGEIIYRSTMPEFSFNFVRDSCRAAGYSNTQAIMDVVDNSAEDNVGATEIYIVLKYIKKGSWRKEIREIAIVDNGCGMDAETMRKALAFGGDNGKERSIDMGSYGVGMKKAMLSIGNRVEVVSKTKNSDIVTKGYIDISYKNDRFNEPIDIQISQETIDEYNENDWSAGYLKYMSGDSGTIVRCKNIDRLQIDFLESILSQIRKDISISHGLIIKNGKKIGIVSEQINGDNIQTEWISPANFTCENVDGRIVIGEGDIKNRNMHYIAYYIPSTQNIPYPRSNEMSGLFVYRNRRIVGYGVNFATKMEDDKRYRNGSGVYVHRQDSSRSEYIGLRVELFASGDDDIAFRMSDTKILKPFTSWEVSLQKDICDTLGKYAEIVRRMDDEKKDRLDEKSFGHISKIVDLISKCKELRELIKNSSDFLSKQKKGKEQGKDEVKQLFNTSESQSDKQNNKEQENKKEEPKEKTQENNKDEFGKTDHLTQTPKASFNVSISSYGKDVSFVRFNGNTIEINSDNSVYKNTFNKIGTQGQQLVIEVLASMMIASSNAKADCDDKTCDKIDGTINDIVHLFETINNNLPVMKKQY